MRAPSAGEIMRNPTLAETFRTLGREGKNGFYTGRIAEQIVKVVSDLGGKLTLDDLAHHLETGSESVDPIGLDFTAQGCEGIKVWEHPPNGQGIVALMALGVIQELEKSGKIPRWGPEDFNTAPYLHAIIEALRLGFTDASWYVADPNVADVPTQGLISPAYLAERAKLFDPAKASEPPLARGDPTAVSPALNSSDTVYFCVADAEGNATSFINSNYGGFGTCIVPSGTGFTLQNRGANFSLDEGHPNSLEPRKRPYHTIIPGLTTNLSDGSLHSAFGVMGGFMQPQGHVQVLLGQVVGGLDPQQALDAPRVCVTVREPTDENRKDWVVQVEDGMKPEVIEGLKERGHLVEVAAQEALKEAGVEEFTVAVVTSEELPGSGEMRMLMNFGYRAHFRVQERNHGNRVECLCPLCVCYTRPSLAWNPRDIIPFPRAKLCKPPQRFTTSAHQPAPSAPPATSPAPRSGASRPECRTRRQTPPRGRAAGSSASQSTP